MGEKGPTRWRRLRVWLRGECRRLMMPSFLFTGPEASYLAKMLSLLVRLELCWLLEQLKRFPRGA